MKSLFITFEGIDGCGKSTQIQYALSYFKEHNIDCIISREPGGTSISEKIRNIILDINNKEMSNTTELLLYCASRAQHCDEKIKPMLSQGISVLCDRFQDATFAYQGYGRELDLKHIKMINSYATQGLFPDRVYLFDIDVNIAITRMINAKKIADRLESESIMFYEKIRNGYLSLAKEFPEKYCIIDASLQINDVKNIMINDLINLIER